MHLVTIIGGTGVFGSRIARNLRAMPGIALRLVGRDIQKGERLAAEWGCEYRFADVLQSKSTSRAIEDSHIVIHAAGPFQVRDYRVAETCIEAGCHYIDLADAREFVIGIRSLDTTARKRNIFVTSGASSVPAVTHAMVSELQKGFREIRSISMALSPGNQNPRGASTIAAILTYLGRPIRMFIDGQWIQKRGWGDARWLEFPAPVGWRRAHNCDVPDLELFPGLFGAQSVMFQAGVELNIINYALSAIAYIRRVIPLDNLHRAASHFLRASLWLYKFGSGNGSLAVWVRGIDLDGNKMTRCLAIVTSKDGPATPCAVSTILAQKIIATGPPEVGAFACVGYLSLSEIESHLRQFGVWVAQGDERGWSLH